MSMSITKWLAAGCPLSDRPFLRNANLRNANLRNANLRNANLNGANLNSTDLRDADLSGANLRNADLRDANLGNANLRNADLQYADLRDADLSDTGLIVVQIACQTAYIGRETMRVGCKSMTHADWLAVKKVENVDITPYRDVLTALFALVTR